MPVYTNKIHISLAIKEADSEAILQSVYTSHSVFIANDTQLKNQYSDKMISLKQEAKRTKTKA